VNRSILVGLTAALMGLSGCALFGGGEEESRATTPRERELTLYVDNQNFYDATLYAVDGGYRQRLGVVGGHNEDVFRFRWPYLQLRIEIRLLSVGSHTTYELPVDEGDDLELRIQPDLHRRIPPDGR
jgi:outer membrane biogenesis lipoprotein LolB